MKENILDVLMYLFENYVDDDIDLYEQQENLTSELVEAGFRRGEINKAFQWLEGLSQQQETLTQQGKPHSAFRIYTPQECAKLDVEARGFLLFLEQVGVLDQQSREITVDRAMALETSEIDLDQLKWVVLMVLFNQPGYEAAFAWIEDMVLDENAYILH